MPFYSAQPTPLKHFHFQHPHCTISQPPPLLSTQPLIYTPRDARPMNLLLRKVKIRKQIVYLTKIKLIAAADKSRRATHAAREKQRVTLPLTRSCSCSCCTRCCCSCSCCSCCLKNRWIMNWRFVSVFMRKSISPHYLFGELQRDSHLECLTQGHTQPCYVLTWVSRLEIDLKPAPCE